MCETCPIGHVTESLFLFPFLRFHDNLSAYYGANIPGNVIGKVQDAVKSYFKDKEMPPEVADVANIVSDAVKAPAGSSTEGQG